MAKTLVLYQSSHGNTQKILSQIIDTVDKDVDMVQIKGFNASELEKYDTVAFGGSIHAGSIQKEVKNFADKNEDTLIKKRLALFIGCLDKDNYAEHIESSFPENLKNHAELKTCIGGDVVMEKLPALMRMIMKRMTKSEEERHFIHDKGRKALRDFLNG